MAKKIKNTDSPVRPVKMMELPSDPSSSNKDYFKKQMTTLFKH